MKNNIDIYDKHEKKILKKISNSEIQRFSPLCFIQNNFPHKVSSKDELIRYVDSMHNNDKFLNEDYKYNKNDKTIVGRIVGIIKEVTLKNFNQACVPFQTILADLNAYKNIIKYIKFHSEKKNINVLEIGPGSGLLGLMLTLDKKIKYSSIEVTQAFYLWQQLLYKKIDKKFVENDFSSDFLFTKKARIKQIPWWHILIKKDKILDTNEHCEVIICNHALGEMHPDALVIYLKIIRKLLENSQKKFSKNSFFLVSSLGQLHSSNQIEIYEKLNDAGFKIIFEKSLLVCVTKNSNIGKKIYFPKNILKNKIIFFFTRILNRFFFKKMNYFKNTDIVNSDVLTWKDLFKNIKIVHSMEALFFQFLKNKH